MVDGARGLGRGGRVDCGDWAGLAWSARLAAVTVLAGLAGLTGRARLAELAELAGLATLAELAGLAGGDPRPTWGPKIRKSISWLAT